MNIFARRLAVTFLVAGLAAGCTITSDKRDAPSVGSQIVAASKLAIAGLNAEKPPKTIVSPEVLAKIEVPVLQINPEETGGSDFLTRSVTRRDSNRGTIAVWNSSDKAQVILRNGVLVATRGIGGDIIAANANLTIRALGTGENLSGTRRYTFSDGDVTTTELVFRCDIQNLGPGRINIANQSFGARHMRENCTGVTRKDLRIINDYWVQPASGVVRQSRQWVSEDSGYFEFILLRN